MNRNSQTFEDLLQGDVEIDQNLRQAGLHPKNIETDIARIDMSIILYYINHNVISIGRCRIKSTKVQNNKNKRRKRGKGGERRDTIFDINVFVALCPVILMQQRRFGFQITTRVHLSNFSSIRSCVSISRGTLHQGKKTSV